MLKAGEKFSDEERAGLSDAELEALDAGDGEEDLEAIAGATDDDVDADPKDKSAPKGGDDRTEDEKEADRVAAEEAKRAKKGGKTDDEDADAEAEEKKRVAAEAKAKEEAEAKIKAAADAAAEAAKKAGKDDAAQKAAREEAAKKAREELGQGAADETAGAADEAGDDEIETDDYVPPYVAPKPDKYDERIVAFDKKEDELDAKFKKGDIELDELNKEKRAIAKDRAKLEGEMQAHNITAQLAEEAGNRHWNWEIRRFMRDVLRNEGIDYADSRRLNDALDARVKAIASKPENADKPGRWFLQEAHKQVKAELKVGDHGKATDAKTKAAAAAKAKEETERKAKEEALRKRRQEAGKKDLKRGLGDLPAAGDTDLGKDGDGEFAEAEAMLEGGDSMKLEAYIAGKSAEWQERWARHSN
jgi:hypothetical protein